MPSLAHDLALLAHSTEMSPERRCEFYALAARVRRMEITLDEIYQDAREYAALTDLAPNVVRVEFRGIKCASTV